MFGFNVSFIFTERVGAAIKDRIVVRYVNDFGENESGKLGRK